MRTVFKAIGWSLALAIVVLSVVPPSERAVTGAPHNLEHLGIYLLTGIAFALAYREQLIVAAAGLAAFSGLVELAQLGVPGRHARLSDFVVDAVAACAGVATVAIGERWLNQKKV